MSTFPVTIGGETFQSSSFAGLGYYAAYPSLLKAFEREFASSVATSVRILADIAPMDQVLYTRLPGGMNLVSHQLLVFTGANSGGRFIGRVLSYNRSNGEVFMQVVLVMDQSPDTEWLVGIMPGADVDDEADASGSGMGTSKASNAIRTLLGIPGQSFLQFHDDFLSPGLSGQWSVWNSPGISLPTGTQWDGTGTEPTASYVHLESASDLTRIRTHLQSTNGINRLRTRFRCDLPAHGDPANKARMEIAIFNRDTGDLWWVYFDTGFSSEYWIGTWIGGVLDSQGTGESLSNFWVELEVVWYSALNTTTFIMDGVPVYSGSGAVAPGPVELDIMVHRLSGSLRPSVDVDYAYFESTP
jgi:hypothetical protein